MFLLSLVLHAPDAEPKPGVCRRRAIFAVWRGVGKWRVLAARAGTGCAAAWEPAAQRLGASCRIGHRSGGGTGDGLPSGVASDDGGGKLLCETDRLAISVSF